MSPPRPPRIDGDSGRGPLEQPVERTPTLLGSASQGGKSEDNQEAGDNDSQADRLSRSVTIRTAAALERLPTFIDPHRGLRHQGSVLTSVANVREVYNVMEVMGTGGFGVVYRVEQQGTQRPLALKSVPVDKVKDPAVFHRELSIARRLKHPYIIRLHSNFQDAEAYHLVMDLCTGGDFLNRMRQTIEVAADGSVLGGLPPLELSRCLGQMLNGIAYLHNYSLAHRDVKPENYLLEDDAPGANLKLIDFGLARSFSHGQRMLSKVGSVGYVAPEVITSSNGYDATCDIWGVGVTACVLGIAAKPFSGTSIPDYLRSARKGRSAVFDDDRWDRQPTQIKDAIGQMLAVNPEKRPHAKALLQANPWLCQACPRGGGQAGPCCCAVQ